MRTKAKSGDETARKVELPSNGLLQEVKKGGGTVILTHRGRTTAVVLDLKSYRRMIAKVDQLEDIKAVRRGLEAARRGQVQPWDRAEAEIRKGLGLPRRRYRTRKS